MTLRSTLVALLAVTALGAAAVPAHAGTGDYASPLYLAGPTSTLPNLAGKSFQLVAAAKVPPAPTATNTLAGTGPPGGATPNYRYVYSVDSGSGEVASLVSNTVVSTGNAISLSGLPTGVTVRIYRQNVSTGSNYFRLATLSPNSSSTYTDANTPAPVDTGAARKAENRVQNPALGCVAPTITPCTGYFDFQPNVVLGAVTSNDDVDPFPPPAISARGFVVDGAGSVYIPSGPWTFTVQTKNGGNANGVANLVVGIWKVNDSGNVVGSALLAPTANTTTNLITATSSIQTVTVTAANVGAVSLGPNEHLYVQFWRHQSTGFTSGGFPNRLVTMYFLDGFARIEHPGAAPNPSLPSHVSPAAGATVRTWPGLVARFEDPDAGDTGSVDFQLCSDAACATVLQSATAGGVARGATASWTPDARPDGTYYWRVYSRDAATGVSGWSATRSFAYAPDRTPPSAPTLASPADGTVTNAPPSMSVVHNDPESDAGTVELRVCTAAATAGSACSPLASGGSLVVGPGATAVFGFPLAEGGYHWQARALDPAGNASPWTATRAFGYDVTPPPEPVLEWPAANAVTGEAAGLRARFPAGDGAGGSLELRVCAAPAAGSACADPLATGSATVTTDGGAGTFAPPLPEGTYHWQARAVDAAGNASPWTATRSFTFDTTPPPVPVLQSPRDGLLTRIAPTLRARYEDRPDDVGALEFRVCADAACAAVVASSASPTATGHTTSFAPDLAYGDYHWQARAVDRAGNTSPWTDPWSFTYGPGGTGRGPHLPLEAAPVSPPLFGLAVEPVTCRTKARLRVLLVLRDPAQVSFVLVEKVRRGEARWRPVASKRLLLSAGTRNVEIPIARTLSRKLRYELRVDVDAGVVEESRSVAVRLVDERRAQSNAAVASCDTAP